MALNKDLGTTTFCSLSQIFHATRKFGSGAMLPFGVGISFRVNSGNEMIVKGCLSCYEGSFRSVEGLGKVHAVAPCKQFACDAENGSGKDMGVKLLNAHDAYEHGKPLWYTDQTVPAKLVVAVDVDEVLGSFLSALNKFIAERYTSNHTVSEYHVYEFCKIWNCSSKEAEIRVHEFFKTTFFKKGIHPLPGAQQALHRLSTFCSLSVVTSRQNIIKDHTIEWIKKHYPGLFQEIHFGNHFAMDGKSRPKSEICRSLKAQVLIDDNPRYAIECAEAGMKVLLFDYDNSYPWCKTGSADLHPLVTKVHDWAEVEGQLNSWRE